MGHFFYIIILFLLGHVHFCCSRNLDFNVSEKHSQKHLISSSNFRLPSPLPTWPKGGGFGSGAIDLGGLKVYQVSSLKKVWSILEGGHDNQGATFYEPSSIPGGFFMLGSYSQPNNKPLFGWVLAAKDLSPNKDILKKPTDYSLVWSSKALKNISQEGVGYIWLPIPPEGYKAVGLVITNSSEKPPLDKVRCVRADFTDEHTHDQFIWGSSNGLNIHSAKPSDQSPEARALSARTFIVTLDPGAPVPDSCLKNLATNSSNSMPDLNQIQALIQEYSPRFYFHPWEAYYPSTVNWLFENGALLYTNGQGSVPISPDGSNLPQGGANDGAFWLDLPVDGAERERVKAGDLQDAGVYIHAKPALGETHTDLAIWVFYPFNGAGKAKVAFFDIGLGKIGEHVGDWEHVTLRINNFNGALESVFFSQHSGGQWVDVVYLEHLDGTNKVVVYSSLHGHAAYPNPGENLSGGGVVKIRNDAGKGDRFLDTSFKFTVISAGYLGPAVVEPAWLNYAREWGPKIDYNLDEELNKVKNVLPWLLKKVFEKAVKAIPTEALYEEGPTGPKMHGSWVGDENAYTGPYF